MKKVSYKPIILPSEDSELKSFIEENDGECIKFYRIFS